MDEDQIHKLGDKMKDVYDDVQAHAEGTADQAKSELQNAYGSAKNAAREGADTMEAQLGSFVKQRPMTALLAAAGLGYVFSRLTHRR